MAQNFPSLSPRVAELSKRLQREPNSRAFFDLAREHHFAGNLTDAARICGDGLKKHPAYHSARVLLGRVLLEMKEFPRARAELESVVKQAPDNLMARRLLGDALAGANESTAALEMYRTLLVFNPEDPEALHRIEEIERESAASLAPQGRAGTETLPAIAPPVRDLPVEEAQKAMPPGRATAPPPEGKSSDPALFETLAGDLQVEAPHPMAAMGEIGSTVVMKPAAIVEMLKQGPPEVRTGPGSSLGESPDSPPAMDDRSEAGPELSGATVVMKPSAIADLLRGSMEPGIQEASEQGPPNEPRAGTASGATAEAGVRDDEPTLGALPTPTLAEIYLAQGHPEKALEVYRNVLDGDPHNDEIRVRFENLSARLTPDGSVADRKIRALQGWLSKIRRG